MAQRILVVEDEPELRRALQVRLTAAGYTCEMADDGIEGLAKARAEHPDLVVVDLIMPEADGYNLCRQLQRDERTSTIPVLVLTVVSRYLLGRRRKDQQPKRLVGQPRVLNKPFDSEEFLSAVRELLAGT